MKVNMSKTQFKELLEEYISNLEKDYDSNQTGNSNHPTYSLIKNTYKKIEDKYFYRKLGFHSNIFLILFGIYSNNYCHTFPPIGFLHSISIYDLIFLLYSCNQTY